MIFYNSKFYLLNIHSHFIVRIDEYLLFVKIMQAICIQGKFKTAYNTKIYLNSTLKKRRDPEKSTK